MNVVGLDGKQYKLKLDNKERKTSSGHQRARVLLKELFPFYHIYEEVFVPGCRANMYIDLFIQKLMLAVEIQGRQHSQFVPFYHGTINEFRKQQRRDGEKSDFCRTNGITICHLPDDESDEIWREIIRQCTTRPS